MQFEYHTFLSLSSKIIDNRGKTCPTSSVGIPLIATNCVKNDTLYPSYEKVRYISQETYSNWFRGHPEPGDLIFVTKGSPGQVCLAPDPVDFCIAQDMVAFRVDEKKVNSRYLFAVLRSPSIQTKIENMHVGTLIPHFKKGDFDKLDIPIPKPEYQKLIGDYFYYLSLKIELNRRMNETLEAMAKALFKSWFVDFDPIRAKAEGRQPEGLAPEIADLFPDGFEDSELGEIPRGWEVKTLGIISNYLKRGISPKYVEEGGVCVINQKCIRNGWLDISKARRHNSELRSVEGREIEIGDILVNSTGVGTLGRVAQVLDMPETMIVDSHVTIVRPNPETIKPNVLGIGLLGKEADIEAMGEGSTGQTELSRENLSNLKILVPPFGIQEYFEDIVIPLRKKMIISFFQSSKLSILRDSLLPKLMSGDLRVKDVEALMEDI